MSGVTTWHQAMRRARALDPDRIGRAITALADNGLRATTYDRDGGRSTAVPCTDEWCEDGPYPHSHPTVSDPTGQAAMNPRQRSTLDAEHLADLTNLDRASQTFVAKACIVLDWVAGTRPGSWRAVVAANDMLMPGTIQAGLDVDDERILPHVIAEVARAVDQVESIGSRYLRAPTVDERHWTEGYADEACCSWHLEVEPRGMHRRLRAGGTNVCAECVQIIEWCGTKPPMWFMEALVAKEAQPIAYRRALSRLVDELGLSA